MPSSTRRAREPFETSLGPRAEPGAGCWDVDLSTLPIFRGLSVLSRALADMVVAQAQRGRLDINAEREIRSRENPELRGHLGVSRVRVCAEHETVAAIVRQPGCFGDHLRALFGTLQRARYREALIPGASGKPSRALVFHFDFPDDAGPLRFRFVLEFVPPHAAEGTGALRVTIEDPRGRHLQLDSIPHLEVEGVENRTFIAGSTRIAQTWREGLRREAERGRLSFVDRRSPRSHLFQQLDRAGLGLLRSVEISWGEELIPALMSGEPEDLDPPLKKILLALEDRELRRLLMERETVRIALGETAAYLDMSQHARVLNVSLGRIRERVELADFLERMPRTLACCQDPETLSGTKVFLIHHITAEVLGLIAALRRLGCRDLTTLFVSYAGDPPPSYLDPLLELPADEFRALALASIPEPGRVEGHYQLSTQYSVLPDETKLSAALARGRPRFFEAMQRLAKLAFAKQLERAESEGQRCLLIEDGGYLGPDLNRACLEGQSVADFLGADDPDCRDPRPLRELLDRHFAGSVEHTRNGYDRLRAVQDEHGQLAFPAFSIAVSKHKLEVEAREVAASILNAIDNILHASGLVLSRRNCLVLGSRGAIGRHLVEFLLQRLVGGAAQLAGVDLCADASGGSGVIPETQSYLELPQQVRQQTDLVLGVTGCSILRGEDIEAWILEGRSKRLLLASGSTKTEEFSDVSRWVERTLAAAAPRIGDVEIAVSPRELRDPLTGRVFGHRYRFSLETSEGQRERELDLLANLTPVNFLFYGVPTELIDEVLAQLVGCAGGLLRRSAEAGLAPRLHAVDHEIDAQGKELSRPTADGRKEGRHS